MVENYSKGKVLDLGCGWGDFSNYLQKRGFDVTGIDLDPDNLKTAKNKNKNIRFILADITKLHLKEKYDTILLLGVLDYLVNVEPVEFLSGLKGLLNKGGRILLQVANSNCLRKRIKTLLNYEPVMVFSHYDFNNKRIKRIINSAGYQIIKFTSTKLWTFRKYRPYMPFDSLATEFFIVIEPKN